MTDCNQEAIAVVTTTVGSLDHARRLARAIVDARLGACVQLDAIAASFYRWEGRSCEDAEVRLTIKTTPAQVDALHALFAQEHPYDLPQFIVARCGASAAYAQWVRSEVGT